MTPKELRDLALKYNACGLATAYLLSCGTLEEAMAHPQASEWAFWLLEHETYEELADADKLKAVTVASRVPYWAAKLLGLGKPLPPEAVGIAMRHHFTPDQIDKVAARHAPTMLAVVKTLYGYYFNTARQAASRTVANMTYPELCRLAGAEDETRLPMDDAFIEQYLKSSPGHARDHKPEMLSIALGMPMVAFRWELPSETSAYILYPGVRRSFQVRVVNPGAELPMERILMELCWHATTHEDCPLWLEGQEDPMPRSKNTHPYLETRTGDLWVERYSGLRGEPPLEQRKMDLPRIMAWTALNISTDWKFL